MKHKENNCMQRVLYFLCAYMKMSNKGREWFFNWDVRYKSIFLKMKCIIVLINYMYSSLLEVMKLNNKMCVSNKSWQIPCKVSRTVIVHIYKVLKYGLAGKRQLCYYIFLIFKDSMYLFILAHMDGWQWWHIQYVCPYKKYAWE